MGITDNLVAKLDAFIEQMVTPRALEQQTANHSLSIWGKGGNLAEIMQKSRAVVSWQ